MQGALPQTPRVAIRRPGRALSPKTLRRLLIYITIVAVGIIFVLPLLWMVATAFKSSGEWYTLNLIPHRPTLDNFMQLLGYKDAPIVRWFFNSALVATVYAFLNVAISAPAAYAYARLDFKGRDVIFGIMIATLLVPGVVFLIPNYLITFKLGLVNTYGAVIIPGLGGVFGVFFLRQFFLGLPTEIEEAMLMDGANRLRILWSMVIPLSRGALATLFVLGFLANWNDFLWPTITLTTTDILTLPVGIASFAGEYNSFPGVVMAGGIIATIPVLVVFTALQRFIVQSVASAAIKG